MYFKRICILLSTFLVVSAEINDEFAKKYPRHRSVVYTKTGYVEGGISYSRSRRPFHYFKGIPYAKPPLKNLRFKAPEEPEPWKGIRQAKKHGSICIQWNTLTERIPLPIGEEDCLYINVYTPRLFDRNLPLLPVMFLIHYGGFFSGNGNSDIFGPEYLLDKDVILVTFNYRLGVLGLLTTGDDVAPGNYGFKDQNMALKWVRDNIRNFGGDKDRVTIFGNSGGAAAVHHHILSPVSKNLFNAAITQSGSALNVWAYPLNGDFLYESITKRHAGFVGCPDYSKQELIDCMRRVDAYDLVYTLRNFSYFFIEPLIHYFPTIEKKTEANPNPFIIQSPQETIRKKEFSNVPWISGVVTSEGIIRAAPYIRNSELLSEINANFEELIPSISALSLSTPSNLLPYAIEDVFNYFLPNRNINVHNPSDIQAFVDLLGDRYVNYGVYQQTLGHALHGHNSIWFYNFNYKGAKTYGDEYALTDNDVNYNWGVAHCDELIYLFTSSKFWKKLNCSDLIMVDIMVEMWTNFATYHDPTPLSKEELGHKFKWKKLPNLSYKSKALNSDLRYMTINGNHKGEISLSMENSYLPERMKYWNKFNFSETVPNVI